jgi:hypothetical protein
MSTIMDTLVVICVYLLIGNLNGQLKCHIVIGKLATKLAHTHLYCIRDSA